MICSQETAAKLFQVFCIGKILIDKNSCRDFVGYFYNAIPKKCIRACMHTMHIDNNLISLIMYILIHKQMPILILKGLSTTFEGLRNVYCYTNLLTFVTTGENICTTVCHFIS